MCKKEQQRYTLFISTMPLLLQFSIFHSMADTEIQKSTHGSREPKKVVAKKKNPHIFIRPQIKKEFAGRTKEQTIRETRTCCAISFLPRNPLYSIQFQKREGGKKVQILFLLSFPMPLKHVLFDLANEIWCTPGFSFWVMEIYANAEENGRSTVRHGASELERA